MATAADYRPTQPMVEPLALPAYGIIAFGCTSSAALIALTGFTVAPSVWIIFALPSLFAVAGMLGRRVGHSFIANCLEGIAIVYWQGLAFLLAMFALTVLGRPLADNSLAAADQALGFNWTAYAWAMAPVIDPLTIAYNSMNWQPVLLIVVLASHPERMWRFVFAGALAVALTTAIYPFAPAVGAFRHFAIIGYPAVGDTPLKFGSVIELLRSGHRTITLDLLTGFVSFPSYHTAAGFIFVWAAWPTRWLRLALLPLNVALVAAAPVLGGHYLIDIIAGAVVGLVSIYGAIVVIPSGAGTTQVAARTRLCPIH